MISYHLHINNQLYPQAQTQSHSCIAFAYSRDSTSDQKGGLFSILNLHTPLFFKISIIFLFPFYVKILSNPLIILFIFISFILFNPWSIGPSYVTKLDIFLTIVNTNLTYKHKKNSQVQFYLCLLHWLFWSSSIDQSLQQWISIPKFTHTIFSSSFSFFSHHCAKQERFIFCSWERYPIGYISATQLKNHIKVSIFTTFQG